MDHTGAFLVTALLASQPASAAEMSLADATTRLAGIDAALAACLSDRMSAGPVAPAALRGCIAAARPGDRALRKDLNGWIPLLDEADPDREAALRTRQALNTLRAFMNALDTGFLYRRSAIAPADLDAALRVACRTSGMVPADGRAAERHDLRVASFCD